MFVAPIRLLNALLMITMPLVLGVYLFRRLGTAWQLFGMGAVTFISSQILHIPFNVWALNPLIDSLGLDLQVTGQLAIVALLLGLSAGLFEEISRYIVYRFWLKGKGDRSWRGALMFGAGHGGIEAIILGVIVTYGFMQLLALKDANLEALIPWDQLEVTRVQVEMYWSAPWYAAILGAVERAATLCFHLSASVLVLQVFRRKNLSWLFLAIGWHAAADALAVFVSRTWNIYIAEALIVLVGLLGLVVVFLLRDPPVEPDGQAPSHVEATPIDIKLQKPSSDHLEDSRYV
jgi:uncharacterized membrane protein YhfC